MEAEIARIHEESSAEGYWDDPEHAQERMQHLASLEADVTEWRELANRAEQLAELAALTEEEEDESFLAEIRDEASGLERRLADVRLRLIMSGPHDRRDAIVT